MDSDVNDIPPDRGLERQRLQDELNVVQAWSQHPVSKRVLDEITSDINRLENLILDPKIRDLSDLVTHFVMIGHRRGLKRTQAVVQMKQDEIQQEIDQL